MIEFKKVPLMRLGNQWVNPQFIAAVKDSVKLRTKIYIVGVSKPVEVSQDEWISCLNRYFTTLGIPVD